MIGIDNGLDGGIVQVVDGRIIASMAMRCDNHPYRVTKKKKPFRILAPANLSEFLESHYAEIPDDIVIERPGGSKNVSAAASMQGSYQSLLTAIYYEGYRIAAHVTPASWQKYFGIKAPTKDNALAFALEYFGDGAVSGLPRHGPRTDRPHDGVIDAALIALYGEMNDL